MFATEAKELTKSRTCVIREEILEDIRKKCLSGDYSTTYYNLDYSDQEALKNAGYKVNRRVDLDSESDSWGTNFGWVISWL